MIIIFKDNKSLLFFWKIGKETSNYINCDNPVKTLSDYYSYKYGNSYKFSRENIINMKLFYNCFPIYIDKMKELDWELYKVLIRINSKKERMFYYYVSLFLKSNVDELIFNISNDYYNRIKKSG